MILAQAFRKTVRDGSMDCGRIRAGLSRPMRQAPRKLFLEQFLAFQRFSYTILGAQRQC